MIATDGTHSLLTAKCFIAALMLCCAQVLHADDESQLANAPPKAEAASMVVKITVRGTAEVPSRDVCIADVANLEGGSAALREWIGKLDVADPPRTGQPVRVTRQQIDFRVRLAGLDDRLFSIEGSRDVAVSSATSELSDAEIIATAEKFVRARLPWDRDDVVIQPAQSLPAKVTLPISKSAVRLEPSLRSQRTPIGRVRIDVAIWADGRKQQEIPVILDIQVFQSVAVAKRRIERGQLLTEDNLHFDRRSIVDATDFLTAKDAPIGQRAKRAIAAAQVIANADIEPADAEKRVLVKAGDVVKIVARAGNMQLSTTGEALQEGPAGKMIRVRNVDSKKVVNGRILDKSTVEVLR